MQREASIKTGDRGGAPRGKAQLPGACHVDVPCLPLLCPASTWAWTLSAASRVFTHGDQGTPSSLAHRKASEAVDTDGSGSPASTCPGAQNESSRGEGSVPFAVLATRRSL